MSAHVDLWSADRVSTYPWESKPAVGAGPSVAALLRLAVEAPQLVASAVHTANRALAAVNDLVDLVEEGVDLVHELHGLVARLEPVVSLAEEAVVKVDPGELVSRVRRVEQALLNTERASINLDKTVEGSIESLPSPLSRRARRESQKIDPTRPPQAH